MQKTLQNKGQTYVCQLLLIFVPKIIFFKSPFKLIVAMPLIANSFDFQET